MSQIVFLCRSASILEQVASALRYLGLFAVGNAVRANPLAHAATVADGIQGFLRGGGFGSKGKGGAAGGSDAGGFGMAARARAAGGSDYGVYGCKGRAGGYGGSDSDDRGIAGVAGGGCV